MFAAFIHILSNLESECLGDVTIWDGGVVPKALERLWSRKVLLIHLWGSVVAGECLSELLFVKEGKLCVKVADGPFPEKKSLCRYWR